MKLPENSFRFSLLALSWLVGDTSAFAADLIVSANDAKYVRVLARISRAFLEINTLNAG
jgi:hypothetical protein